MVTENRQQGNKNLHKPKISNLSDIIALISYFTHHSNRSLIKVMSYLAAIGNTHKNIFPSIRTISRMCDISEDQVIRILKIGEEIGLWSITHRKDYEKSTNKFGILSNLYKLNPLFFDMNWRNSLQGIIPAFRHLPLTVLLITTSIIAKNNTPNLESGSRRKGAATYLDFNIFVKKQNAYRAYAREEFAICQKQTKKLEAHIRERVVMNDTAVLYDNAVFSETVRKAGKEMMMSCAGMCSISSFNDMVINVALKRIETYSKTIQNPFGLFISICNQVSKEMRMPVKHNKAYALASQFDIKLGKDAAILEGGNLPKEPSKKIDLQREGKKLSPHANRHLAPTNKVSVLPLSALQLKNPSISIVGVKHISQGIVEIQHHTDTEWRETTQEERDIWLHTIQKAWIKMPRQYVQFMPKLEPPLYSKGDPNTVAFKFYHIDQDNVLHNPDEQKIGCKLCDKKRKIC